MQDPIPVSAARVRSWLTRHGVVIVATALCCLGLHCLLPTSKPPAAPPGPALPLSKRAARRARQAQAARLDSIRQETAKLPVLERARDSALTAARRHSHRATYYLNRLHHETNSPAPAAEHLARALAAYQPGTYALDSTRSLW